MTIRTLSRWVSYFLIFIVTILIIAILVIRFFVFPNIDEYKDEIATYASETIQRKITIGDIQTGWRHISPRVTLVDVSIYDEQNRPALTLKKIDTQLSWLSLGLLDLRLSELTAHSPKLIIRRSKEGIFYLAGVNLSGRGNPSFANWILAQSKVGIRNASVTYIDEKRNTPPLSLQQLNLTLSNSAWKSLFGRHEFQLSALSSVGTKQPIRLSGYFIGRDMSNLKDWRGNVHASLQKTDIAVWRPWVDYPIQLQSGIGDAEADLHFSKLAIDAIDADVEFQHLSIGHPNKNKPLIASKLQGFLGWKKANHTETITLKEFNLALNTGLVVESANGEWVSTIKKNKPWIDAYLSVQSLHMSKVAEAAEYFALSPSWINWIAGVSPNGNIKVLKTAVSGHH